MSEAEAWAEPEAEMKQAKTMTTEQLAQKRVAVTGAPVEAPSKEGVAKAAEGDEDDEAKNKLQPVCTDNAMLAVLLA